MAPIISVHADSMQDVNTHPDGIVGCWVEGNVYDLDRITSDPEYCQRKTVMLYLTPDQIRHLAATLPPA